MRSKPLGRVVLRRRRESGGRGEGGSRGGDGRDGAKVSPVTCALARGLVVCAVFFSPRAGVRACGRARAPTEERYSRACPSPLCSLCLVAPRSQIARCEGRVFRRAQGGSRRAERKDTKRGVGVE